jgi:hypothetical protein
MVQFELHFIRILSVRLQHDGIIQMSKKSLFTVLCNVIH